MKAIVQDSYGETDVLACREVNQPRISDSEVLVRVVAAGLDRGVWHVMAGRPYLIRIMGYGLRRPKAAALGSDLAGIVAQVGAEVTRFGVGDPVVGIGRGAFAEYAVVNESNLAHKPAALTFEQASSMPVSGITALQAIRERSGVRAGESVLVIGASGGVGTFAVQIAAADGAEVTGVCSSAKVDMVRAIGAEHVVDYTLERIGDAGRRYDVVIDIGGRRSISEIRSVLAPRGRLVIIGGEGGGRWFGGIGRQLRAMVLSMFVRQRLGTFIASADSDRIETLLKLAESGEIVPVIDEVFPLEQTAVAIRRMEEGLVAGKLVVKVFDPD